MTTRKIQTIYLIDDSDDEIFMARTFFKRQKIGADLVAFTNLDAFYHALETDPAFEADGSLVVIDLNLTVCKGTEGVAHIRTLEGGREMLVGISTGSEDPADLLQALDAGADFFVGKPLDRKTIHKIVASVPALSSLDDPDGALMLYRT